MTHTLGGLVTEQEAIETFQEYTGNCCASCLHLRKYEYTERYMLTKDGKLRHIWRRGWNRFTGKRQSYRIVIEHTDYRCAKERFGVVRGRNLVYYVNCPDYTPDEDAIKRLLKTIEHFKTEFKRIEKRKLEKRRLRQ